jgi:hypothetical protein
MKEYNLNLIVVKEKYIKVLMSFFFTYQNRSEFENTEYWLWLRKPGLA